MTSQVMVKRYGSGNWYRCPDAGGQLFVAGFLGAISCPVPAEFCAFEDTSGIRYHESDFSVEWLWFGLIVGAPALAAVLLLCLPGARRTLSKRLKLCCGMRLLKVSRQRHARVEPCQRLQCYRPT